MEQEIKTMDGRVTKLETRNGWHEVTLKSQQHGDMRFSTKLQKVIGDLEVGMAVRIAYKESQNQGTDGKTYTNRYLDSWYNHDGSSLPDPVKESVPAAEPEKRPDWDAKDRGIAYLACQRDAVSVLGQGATSRDIIDLAHELLDAWEHVRFNGQRTAYGEDFDPDGEPF